MKTIRLPTSTSRGLEMNIRSMYRNAKIRNKLFFVFSSILVIYALAGVVLIERLFEVYDENLYSQASSELNVMSNLVYRALQGAETFSFQTATSPDVQAELAKINNGSQDYESGLATQSLYSRLNGLVEQRPYVSSLMIIPQDGSQLLVGTTGAGIPLTSRQVESIIAAAGANVWLLDASQNGFIISGREIREVSNLRLRYMGMLVMQIDVNSLVNDYVHLSNGEAFIVTKGNQVAYSGIPALNAQLPSLTSMGAGDYRIVKVGQIRYFVTHLQTSYDDFGFYNVVPYNNQFTAISQLRYEMFGLYILLFLASEFIALQLATRISRPIEIVTQEMRDVHDGKSTLLNARTAVSLGLDEIGILYEQFHSLLERIDHLIEENYAKELLVVQTELQALQSQINPHFLYNTLNSINWIARINKQDTISEMIEALSNLFRTMMDHSTTMITIGEEVALAKDYLKIQKMRFGERLNAAFDIDERTLECPTPKLIIQPIVENSIRHGLEKMIEPCRILVRCRVEDDDLVVRISDNGPGITGKSLHNILGTVEDNLKKTSIGLANIHKRIRMTYGEGYGLTVNPDFQHGTEIVLRMPFLPS